MFKPCDFCRCSATNYEVFELEYGGELGMVLCDDCLKVCNGECNV